MMKQNQKLLLLCGDSYQDISLLAAVNEAQKLNAKDRNALVLYLGEENAITQEAADIVVACNATGTFISRQINDVSFKSWAIRYRLQHWLVRFEKLSSFLKAFNFPL